MYAIRTIDRGPDGKRAWVLDPQTGQPLGFNSKQEAVEFLNKNCNPLDREKLEVFETILG